MSLLSKFKSLFGSSINLFGIDYSYGGGLTVNQMKAAGVHFVCRYLSESQLSFNSKNISVSEFHNLVNGGLAVVLVWETTAARAMSGFNGGVIDAINANNETRTLGAVGIPIYFAVDFDATAGDQIAIDQYLDGVASVIGRARTGLYAGYWPISRAFNAGKIAYGWQTYAWSGGNWDSRAQLQQYSNGHFIGPADVDFDRATHSDYGQWPRPGNVPPPPPPPPPGTVVEPVLRLGSTGGAVKLLQSLLNKLNAAKLVVDGSFGPLTLAAVKAWQTKKKITVDGIVGPQTWATLGNYS